MLVLFQTVYQRHRSVQCHGKSVPGINRWSDTQQYQSRGFVYPFLHSSADAKDDPPDGYDREKAAAVLAGYEDQDIPEEQKVNVLAIMLEAYSDLTSFPALAGLDSVEQVYSYWHTLAQEGYSGRLVTNVFAGGTVDHGTGLFDRLFPAGLLPKSRPTPTPAISCLRATASQEAIPTTTGSTTG